MCIITYIYIYIIYICMYTYIYIYVYIHISIEREREMYIRILTRITRICNMCVSARSTGPAGT